MKPAKRRNVSPGKASSVSRTDHAFKKNASILVFGAGAIGMTFGGFLSKEHKVTLLGRASHIGAIRKRGLKVSGIWGRHCFRRFFLYSDASKLEKEGEAYDLILVCVKSYDTAKAARTIRRLAGKDTAVLSLQNGLGNIEELHRHLDRRRVLAGRVIFGAEAVSSGHVKITVIANPTAVGETSVNYVTPRAAAISAMFNRAGLPSEPAADINTRLWGKVVYNCALNPLASMIGSHYGFLGEHPLTRAVMEEVIREVYLVARKMKLKMTPGNYQEYTRLFYQKLLPMTYNHHPSMLQDLMNGKKTEIDALNGAVVRCAARLRISVPVNRFLVRAIRRLEKK